jgi:hypothetical protein
LSVNRLTLASNLSTTAGQFLAQTYTVNITSSPAQITLQAASGSSFALNGLDIVPYFTATLTAPSSTTNETSNPYTISSGGGTGPDYTYLINFMDGTGNHVITAEGASYAFNYTYAVNGQYTVQAQVHDFNNHFETVLETVTVTGTSVFHVSPTGNDNNDGSVARPWETVNGVMGHYRFGPGDQILFQGGATFADVGPLHLTGANLTGTAANPVTIGSYGTGHATLHVTTWDANGDADGIRIDDAGGSHPTPRPGRDVVPDFPSHLVVVRRGDLPQCGRHGQDLGLRPRR